MNEPTTLNELLDRAVQKQGTDSGRELARRAQAQEFEIVHTTINSIRNGKYKSAPSDDTIRALGWLAGVSVEAAFTAAGRRLSGPPFAEELPPGVDDLSPKEREAVIGLLRVLIAQRQEIGDHDEEQKSRTQESGTEHGGTGSGSGRSGAPITADPSEFEEAAAKLGKRASKVLHDVDVVVMVDDARTAEVKDETLLQLDQGSQADHELAARKGETEDEKRERLGIPYD